MSKSENLVQVDLLCGTTHMTCWVEPKVRRGSFITLKNSDEPEKLWQVLRVGEEKPRSEIRTDWHNDI